MFVNKSRNPSASEIFSQLFLNKELRSRVLTTLGLLLLVRLGIYIPMPGIDRVAFNLIKYLLIVILLPLLANC